MKTSLLLFLGLLSGCVSLNTVSLTSIPAKRDRQVQAEASKYIFLGLSFDNDFVDEMTGQLKQKCPDGMISGILTKDEAVNYFLYIFWRHHVTATGYCSQGSTARNGVRRPRHPSSLENIDEKSDDDLTQGSME